jgi:hypothetical protein
MDVRKLIFEIWLTRGTAKESGTLKFNKGKKNGFLETSVDNSDNDSCAHKR